MRPSGGVVGSRVSLALALTLTNMNNNDKIVKLSNGAYYDPTPAVSVKIPFGHGTIFWVERSDEYRRTVEITINNTDHKKPWESIIFLIHRSVEYILKAALIHNKPNCNVRKYGHNLDKLIRKCQNQFSNFPEFKSSNINLLMHIEKERYPGDGVNYFVTSGVIEDTIKGILAVRDLLGGKDFVFPSSC